MMEARRLSVAEDVRREDVVQPVEGVETESEASVVVPTTTEMPSSSPIASSTDAVGGPQ